MCWVFSVTWKSKQSPPACSRFLWLLLPFPRALFLQLSDPCLGLAGSIFLSWLRQHRGTAQLMSHGNKLCHLYWETTAETFLLYGKWFHVGVGEALDPLRTTAHCFSYRELSASSLTPCSFFLNYWIHGWFYCLLQNTPLLRFVFLTDVFRGKKCLL